MGETNSSEQEHYGDLLHKCYVDYLARNISRWPPREYDFSKRLGEPDGGTWIRSDASRNWVLRNDSHDDVHWVEWYSRRLSMGLPAEEPEDHDPKPAKKAVSHVNCRSSLASNRSDGSTASYYELPEGCTELQDLISYRNMNAQDGEIIRAIYRKGRASHSDTLRDAKKVLFYAKAEVERLEKYGKES